MSKGIKTKATIKDVKALDKSAVAAERMKQAYIRTKDKAEHGVYAEESSPGEYASDRFSSGVDSVSHEAEILPFRKSKLYLKYSTLSVRCHQKVVISF